VPPGKTALHAGLSGLRKALIEPLQMTLKNRNTIFKSGIIVLLLTAILAIYWQTGAHSFIFYDDEEYVLKNARLRLGFSLENIHWFLTSAYAANWHPLTWFSHILDVKLFGLNAMGHHLTSVALHGINAVLLFLFLHRFTGSMWRSATVAALFAIHPLNVESVAWVAERKNVLSTMFWMLTMYLYACYTERKSKALYLLACSVFTLGLMSKQMLVSIPLILLILDYWPLRRFADAAGSKSSGYFGTPAFRLLLEKVPFLLLAVAASTIALFSQQNAMSSLANTTIAARLANASVSYAAYLRNIFWPNDLAVFYPFPAAIQLWPTIMATTLLLGITVAAIKFRTRHPALLAGWLWYLITLIPVIGIVKIGLHGMADRYAYVPSTGIFIMVTWLLADCSNAVPFRKLLLGGVTGICMILLSMTAWRQVSYWQDTTTLFAHTLAVTKNNYVALCAIGRALEAEGKHDDALHALDEALAAAPWYEYPMTHQGLIYMNQGMFDAAEDKFSGALRRNSNSVASHINLGIILAMRNRLDEAIMHFRSAVYLEPHSAAANYNMAFTLYKLGKVDEAISYYDKSLATDPTDNECHNNLGIALASQRRYADSILHFRKALQLKPDFGDAARNLDVVLQKQANTQRP
jgi:Tfp pilus assembly protein PilF